MKTKINNVLVEVIMNQNYYIGNGMIKYISDCLKKGNTNGILKAKRDKSKVGYWNITQDWFTLYYLSNFR